MPEIKYNLITHKGIKRIGVYFEFNKELNARMKKVAGAKCSSTLNCWHIADTPGNRQICNIKTKKSAPKMASSPVHQPKVNNNSSVHTGKIP